MCGNPFQLLVMLAGITSVLAGKVPAQTFTTLHTFLGNDGASPLGGVVLIDHTLYGCTRDGGDYNNGTVFAIDIDGTAFKTLYSFTGGSDGRGPIIELVSQSSNALYGTAIAGGDSGMGTVFKLNTDGTGFKILHEFTGGSDGSIPYGKVLMTGSTIYGTTYNGGVSSNGVVFALNTDGTGFKILHSFSGPYESGWNLTINDDGALPNASLALTGNALYGTASFGGRSGYGSVFAVSTDGTSFTNLHNFTDGSDGGLPFGDVTIMGRTLYGMTENGGNTGNLPSTGTLFAINTDGSGFTNVYDFSGATDLRYPSPGLTYSGNSFYGTYHGSCFSLGPPSTNNYCDQGFLFTVNTDGTGFATLHTFTGGSDGGFANQGLVLLGNTLFGTTLQGGNGLVGTIFSISLPPLLTITLSGGIALLSWPTNAAGFTLQSTTNLASPLWTTNSPALVVVNGQNSVTNPISGTQQFFRLSQRRTD